MSYQFEDFVAATQQISTTDELCHLLSHRMALEGFENTVFVGLRQGGSFVPHWYELPNAYPEAYMEHSWHESDPILRQTLVAESAFLWGDVEKKIPRKSAAWNCMRACRELGVHSGIAFPLLGPAGRRDVISISRRSDSSFDRTHADLWRAFATQVWWRFQELEDGGTGALSVSQLTPREREVLQWIKHGKSNDQIADILGTSRRTIEFHVSNIQTKLGAPNRIAAVVIGLQQGIVQL